MWPDTLAERIAGWTREIRRIRVALHPTAIQTGCGLPGHSCRWDRAVRSPAQKMPRERLQCSQMQPETLVSEDAEHRKWLSTMIVQLRKHINARFCFIQWIKKYCLLISGLTGLPCGTQALSSYSEQTTLAVVCRLLIALASLVCDEDSRLVGLVVASSRLSCPEACEIFPNQGWNSCPLHWQAES